MTTREEWLEQRRNGIGGSEAAAALGLSPFTSPWHLYHQKRGEIPEDEQTEPMYWGTAHEPAILKRWQEDNPDRTLTVTGFDLIWHPDVPYAFATPDGLVDGDGLVEAKTANAFAASKWEGGQIPDDYRIQAQWYLEVTRRDWCDMAVLIGGSSYDVTRIERDETVGAQLLEKVGEFWQMVVDGTPPDPASYDRIALLYPDHEPEKEFAVSDEWIAELAEAEMLKARADELATRRAAILNRFKVAMGDAEIARHRDNQIATYRTGAKARTLRMSS